MGTQSIFCEYYQKQEFIDRYVSEPEKAIDVIIPVIHTNELWEANLFSIYREIPVNRLLIADGGCIDESITIARKFPRVVVEDHSRYISLGYSIRLLIEHVETDWFAYLHSDVYLPKDWFTIMSRYQQKYDWYGCPMQHTVMVEYNCEYGERPWAGAQIGRKKIFTPGLEKVDDDYIYRQEDFIWRKIIRDNGGIEGFVDDVFHYHQTMHKPSPSGRKIKSLSLSLEMHEEEEIRTWLMQIKGIIKYLLPDNPWVIYEVQSGLIKLVDLKGITIREFREWTRETNFVWIPYLSKTRLLKLKLKQTFLSLMNYLK